MKPLIIQNVVKIFLTYGLYHMIINVTIPAAYIKLLLFLFLKIIFDYNKCTISYIEVKLRGVKKEEGYLYDLLTSLNNIRNHKDFLILFFIVNIFLFYNFLKSNFKLN
jgi:hypothetical protein|tara:strand:- start:1675 stop:1998 length:324 start_codon:yes stop_codon:yes gene_type:complete